MAEMPRDHYAALAALPLVVDGYGAERFELAVSSGFLRVTTTVVLRGGGHEGHGGAREGRGEDVTYVASDHDGFPLDLPLAGTWTLDSFSKRLGELDLFPAGGPTMAGQETYRRWAFESAALDLALRQAGRSLGAALGLEYRPVRFVVSTRLDVTPWLEVEPSLEFKLDPTPDWDAERVACVAATGKVRALDFKSFYEGTPVDNPPDREQYAMVARAFPDAVLEDPALEGPAREALRGEEHRFSFDAPVHSWADVEALGERLAVGAAGAAEAVGAADAPLPRFVNIKPSRFGSLRALLDCVARAQAAGIVLYGGGQFELGVGRGHIQYLASIFHPDTPNDVAPSGYNEVPVPDGLPTSPLPPAVGDRGFAWEA